MENFKRGDLVGSSDEYSMGVFNNTLKTIEVIDPHSAVIVIDPNPFVPSGIARHMNPGEQILEVITNSGVHGFIFTKYVKVLVTL